MYIEYIANSGQRPKVELSDEHIFSVLALPVQTDSGIQVKQVSLFFKNNIVVSCCSGNFNRYDEIVVRLRSGVGKLRQRKADYLFYNLIDTVVDYGFLALELYAEKIQILEDKLFQSPDKSDLNQVHSLRRELLLLRRQLWPQREVVNKILHADDDLHLCDETRLHLRDCVYDYRNAGVFQKT